ncbi:CLUMA_CG009204, isoform A [Clunio marinus]|uniref:CLUMA_CG009204, isoform A n=1 Tax=Clunio marinus TaxID=568069 RepID=A0A1J1I6C6_9DIPT|nr:CLUMA_CG009204, isoform A [Clunio marinus]
MPCFKQDLRRGTDRQLNGRFKVYASLFSIMIIFLVILSCLSLIGVSSKSHNEDSFSKRDENLELKLVHVLFRHGSRTPADTYPNDPHVNETFDPFGWGQLTNVGKQQMFNLGTFLRNRYDRFLDRLLKLDDVHAQSTDVSRTKMSLLLVLAGLYPPQKTSLEWNKNLNWQPIPFSYEELNKDSLLLVRTPCARYAEEMERILHYEVRDEIDQITPLMNELSNITGWEIKTPDDVQSLYSTLKAEKEFGLKLPQWTENFFPQKLQYVTDRSYVLNAFNSELKRLKGGVFVKKAIQDWNEKALNKLKEKIFIYAGHDATVTNILSAFNVWDEQFPDYGITAILELSQHKETKEFGVEIFLRNSTDCEPYQLTIPGCGNFCSLKNLQTLLESNIPQDHDLECKAENEDFTPPPPGGPTRSYAKCTTIGQITMKTELLLTKYFIGIIIIIAAFHISNGHQQIRLRRLKFAVYNIEDCAEEIGIDEENANKLIMGDMTIDSDEAKCFLRCFYKKVGFSSQDDQPAQINFIAQSLKDCVTLKDEILKRIAKKCVELESENECEKAFEFHRCLFKEASKYNDEL